MEKGKVLDLNKSVYDICVNDSRAKSILLNLGLTAVANPKAMGAMKTRTLAQVTPIRGVKLDGVLEKFVEKGYTIEGQSDAEP